MLRLEPETRRVVVGPRSALSRTTIRLGHLNWLAQPLTPGTPQPVTVKVRSMRPPAPAHVAATEDGSTLVTLDAPEAGIAPGQACVIYDGERVLGGGPISRRLDYDSTTESPLPVTVPIGYQAVSVAE